MQGNGEPQPAQVEQFVTDGLVPGIWEQIDDAGDLAAPARLRLQELRGWGG